jgi:hypothetical protein
MMFQLVFAVAVNNELTDKGFEGDIIIPLRLMMVITVLLYMIQQRAWAAEIAQTKEFTIRIRTEEERQTAQKALDVVSKNKGSVGSLMGMVKGGMVKQMVRDVFSNDATTVQAANNNIKRFVDLAEEAVPLTAQRHDGIIRSAEIPGVPEADRTPRERRPPSLSVETVAAAKTGLEIAMAWSERIAGFTQWKGDAVFLGGSCNPTTWRTDQAIPMLAAANIPYYNPQVDNWTPDLVEIEAKEKEKAGCLLFVIDATTRALASILEAAEYVCRGRHVVLCIRDVATGTSFGDELQVTESELKDLNRCRNYLRDVATRHGVTFSSSVRKAVQTIVVSHKMNAGLKVKVEPDIDVALAIQ